MSVNLSTSEGQEKLKEFNREAIDAGYEGVMIKDPNASYKTRRTDAWLKIKPFISVDLQIVGFEPGKPVTKYENTLGAIICRGIDQDRYIEVTVGGGFSDELRDEIWATRDKINGKYVEVKGDALTKTQDNENVWSLRFPVFVCFRPDKDVNNV
jgi:DNA ligase-1